MDQKNEQVREALKALSPKDFLNIGIHQIAYIRPVVKNGEASAYSIHAADGTQLSVLESLDTAIAAVRHNDLQAVTVH